MDIPTNYSSQHWPTKRVSLSNALSIFVATLTSPILEYSGCSSRRQLAWVYLCSPEDVMELNQQLNQPFIPNYELDNYVI
jgi:hypothetical protein